MTHHASLVLDMCMWRSGSGGGGDFSYITTLKIRHTHLNQTDKDD